MMRADVTKYPIRRCNDNTINYAAGKQQRSEAEAPTGGVRVQVFFLMDPPSCWVTVK